MVRDEPLTNALIGLNWIIPWSGLRVTQKDKLDQLWHEKLNGEVLVR